jgi:hypothetical protein
MEQQINIYKEGFNNGYMTLTAYAILNKFDLKEAKKELCEALGINNRVSFYMYKNGKIEPKASQAVAVETVFKKYGITTNIWGK